MLQELKSLTIDVHACHKKGHIDFPNPIMADEMPGAV
jgi:hypothetical protein